MFGLGLGGFGFGWVLDGLGRVGRGGSRILRGLVNVWVIFE